MTPDIKNLESAYDCLTLELSLIEEILCNVPQSDKRGEVLARWLDVIGTFLIADFGQIWAYQPTESPPLKCLPGVCFGKDEAPALREASLAARYDTFKSLPGEAMQTGQVFAVANLLDRTDLPRWDAMKSGQVESAVLLPVSQSANLPSYVFEFFHKHPRTVEPFKIEALNKLSGILSRLLTVTGSSDEQSFADSEYRILLDAVPAMVWYKDRHNRIMACNCHAAEATGLPVDQIVGRRTEEIYPRDAAKYYQDDLEVIKSGKSKRRIVEELRGKNGERIWVSTDKVPYVKNGKVEGIIVFSTDISDLKHAEEELLKIKVELESKVEEHTLELAGANVFFTLSRELLCIADTKGYFTRLNPVWSERLGYSLEELCSRPYLEFVHEDDRERTAGIASQLSEHGYVRDFENRYVAKDGQARWLRWSATVFGDSIYAVAYDITDRKNAEQEIIEINARFTQIGKHVPGMIYQFLVETNGKMSFPYVSEGCKDLLGYEPHEIQADSSLAFGTVHPDDLDLMYAAIKTSCDTMSVFRFEGRFATPDGLRYMRASSSPERLHNGDILFNGLFMDVSDLKGAQEEIKKLNFDLEERFRSLTIVNQELESMAQKLELAYEKALDASKLKSEFVANISHELRTPLSAVIGMCDLLLETSLNAEQTDYATTTRDSARALLTIINDILDFSKIEADKIELEMIDFELFTIVESSVELFLKEVAAKKLSLVTHIDPALPRLVTGDPVRIRQILINLVSNAVKFTDEGEIVVRVIASNRDGSTLWHDGVGALEYARFEVSDTGVGIPVSVRQRLFTPFVQADGSTTRKYGGTGLGLSICKRLADLMEGEIGLVSTQGQGSSFWFTLRLPPAHGVIEIKSCELPVRTDFAIYLVGGSASTKALVTSYLEAEKLQVRTATSIGGMLYGLDKTSGEGLTVRAVLIDAGQLEVDPLSLIDAVRRDSRFKSINVIFMVDGHQRDLAELAYERGADLCLFKPIRRVDLLSAALWKRKDSGFPTDSQEVVVQRSLARRKVSEPLRILVVEDNSLMRNLTVKQLDKFGLVADVAANGAEAVEMAFANEYSLLLMDCQMPVMDGFEATLEIRKRESLKGGHVPIVAMTAYAMSGDREQCIAAGMDDYLSKPVTMDQLERMLEKWLQDVTPPALQIAGAPPRKPKDGKTKGTNPDLKNDAHGDLDESEDVDTPIDIRLVTRHYGDGSLHEILASFAEELQELVPAIALEVKRGDTDTVAKLAHQLKGLVSVLSANEMSETAVRLEQACRNGKVKEIEAQTEKLVNSKNELISFINNFLLSE